MNVLPPYGGKREGVLIAPTGGSGLISDQCMYLQYNIALMGHFYHSITIWFRIIHKLTLCLWMSRLWQVIPQK